MLRKTFKFKLYRNDQKFLKLERQLGISSHIYNHSIALHKRYYRLYGKSLSKAKLQAHLAKLKRIYPFWKLVNSQVIQNIAERIDFGYQKFFKKENKRPPNFRKRKKYKSITFKQTAWKLEKDNVIRLYNRWNFKFWLSRPIEGIIKTVTLKKDAVGDWWVCFSCAGVESDKPKTTTGKIEGFDFGLKTFLTPSEGLTNQSPQYLKRSLKLLRKASKKFSKAVQGSKGFKKAKRKLARIHRHVAFQRLDHHFKLANELCQKFQYLCFEDLCLKGMVKLWGRKVSDLGFAQFTTILGHKAKEYECEVIKIDRFFPSSKLCSACGTLKKDLSLKDRLYTCGSCGLIIDRDRNAAINIKMEGISSINAMISVSQVKPAALVLESPAFRHGE